MSQPAMSDQPPGRYDRFITDDERAALRLHAWNDLSPEIEILRRAIERFVTSLGGTITSRDLRAIATAHGVLADLVSCQLACHAPLDEWNKVVDEALHLSRIHWGLLPPDPVPEPAQPPGGHAPLEPGLPPFREAEVVGENTPCPILEPSGSIQAGRPASRLRKPSIRPP